MNRVVVTALGVVSPIGNSAEKFWSSLTAGRCGIGPITLFDASTFPVAIGGEVKDLEPRAAIMPSLKLNAETQDRKVLLGLVAASEAIRSLGRSGPALLRQAVVHVGVGLEAFSFENLTPHVGRPGMLGEAARSMIGSHPSRLLQTPLDCLGERLADQVGACGGAWTNCSACAAGAQAIGEAWHMLRDGQHEIALAGAADSMLNPLGLGGFALLRVLSVENDLPHRACRPFDATRIGTVLGEGSAFLGLETLDHALRRGAEGSILAEVLGYGSSLDAHSVTDPDPAGQGAVLSMTAALESAGMRPEDVDCVNAHGTGTPKNDAVETAAIKEVLGRRAYEVPVHSVKSMTGHMLAASGAVEAAAAVLTIARRVVPPTINLEHPDPQCDLDYVPGRGRRFEGDTVLSNSFGFGGQNGTLVFGRYL